MQSRTFLKWLHWSAFFLIGYFFLVEPDADGPNAGVKLATHAGMGVLLGNVVAVWVFRYLRKGFVGKPGPKLPNAAKTFRRYNHLALQWGMPLMVATGAFAGFAAPYLIKAFGVLPINTASGSRNLHDFAEEVHEVVFNALLFVIVLHIVFHVWRQFRLKDNALRLILPKPLHRYL